MILINYYLYQSGTRCSKFELAHFAGAYNKIGVLNLAKKEVPRIVPLMEYIYMTVLAFMGNEKPRKRMFCGVLSVFDCNYVNDEIA